MAWVTSEEAARVIGGITSSAVRHRALNNQIKRKPKGDGTKGYLYWVDGAENVLDAVKQGQVTPEPQNVTYDMELDQYVVPPSGRGRKRRQIDGWIARSILDFEQARLEGIDSITIEAPPRPPRIRISDRSIGAVMVTPTDLHVGKHAWMDETGNEYGFDTVRERLLSATEDMLSKVLTFGQPDYWIVGIGSDWWHIDNEESSTQKGTFQDSAGTYAEVAKKGIQLKVDYVNTLRRFAPVKLVPMPGNHDRTTALIVSMMLPMVYKDSPDVEVVESLEPRQYIRVGDVLVGMTHGDGCRVSDLPSLMSVERPVEWGECKHRVWFTGHRHHEEVKEHRGCTLYQMRSLAGSDRWHVRRGYVGSLKALPAYVIDPVEGVVAQFNGLPTM